MSVTSSVWYWSNDGSCDLDTTPVAVMEVLNGDRVWYDNVVLLWRCLGHMTVFVCRCFGGMSGGIDVEWIECLTEFMFGIRTMTMIGWYYLVRNYNLEKWMPSIKLVNEHFWRWNQFCRCPDYILIFISNYFILVLLAYLHYYICCKIGVLRQRKYLCLDIELNIILTLSALCWPVVMVVSYGFTGLIQTLLALSKTMSCMEWNTTPKRQRKFIFAWQISNLVVCVSLTA